ncbi:winged helix-turn-helix domain-containing protein [Nocardia salmonicida]|uniref:GntR family transcriptional regulator n=1 Tax=Nocardia salmonicida TaxID=53431 RepID=UPI0033DB9EA5
MDSDRAGLAAYQRVAEQIKEEIRAGRLRPGVQLPGNRQLADDYSVSLGTAQKALQVLRSEGWVVATPAVGVFVSDEQPDDARGSELETIREELRQLRADTAELSSRLERLEDNRIDG